MQEERDGEIRHQKSSGEIVACKTHQINGKVIYVALLSNGKEAIELLHAAEKKLKEKYLTL